MKNHVIYWLLVLLCLPVYVTSQNNKNVNKEESYVLADASYISDAVFMGRKDSVRAPYFFPSIGYYNKLGFYADVSVSYLTSSEENRVDLFMITGGYKYTSKKFGVGVSGTKYFFDEDSYNVQSEIEGDISGVLSYDFNIFETSITASNYFNKDSSTDFFVGLRLDRSFYTLKNNFLIIPSFTINAGSQYFYQEYYKNNRLGSRKGKGTGSQTVQSYEVGIDEVTEFNILSMELGLSLQYYYKSFIFSVTPEWAFPQSSATITTENEIIEEDLKNTFYWSVGISYWFNIKRKK